jgi:prepilin signal peptidase PulO-like enzyme (type II secretory pathway)
MIQIASIVPGILIGALLNILADDLPHRIRPRGPHCHVCGFAYPRSQWIALIALIAGWQACAQCGSRPAWRKPVVEIVSAAMLVFVLDRFGLTTKSILLALFLECLLLITIVDLEHRLILYITVLPSAIIALAYGLFGSELELLAALTKSIIGGAVGFGVFYVFYLLGFVYSAWVARRRGEPLDEIAFGGGDANLGGVVGLAVGWSGIVVSIFYAVLAGGVVSALYVAFMSLRKRNSLLTPIPYGPFIVFGAVLMLLFSSEVKQFLGGS